jgi:hypothetical protein
VGPKRWSGRVRKKKLVAPAGFRIPDRPVRRLVTLPAR